MIKPITKLTLLTAALLPLSASAKPLFSVWTLDPLGPVGEMATDKGKPFLKQRLIPFKLVRLSQPAQLTKGKALGAGTFLFAVYQSDGKLGFCTIKDQSGGHVAKSLFIPILDQRPCLVDSDHDGKFEASFSVFDKYGSALTPSGNLTAAKPILAPVAYETVAPQSVPVARTFSYTLVRDAKKASHTIAVTYSFGGGEVNMASYSPDSKPDAPNALNVRAKVIESSETGAKIDVSLIPDLYLIGDSGGTFGAGPLPKFIGNSG